jgi:enterochelin esterase-like enzyme
VKGFGVKRLLLAVTAVTVMVIGLLGAYSYGEAYYQHRGFAAIPQLPRAGTGRLLRVTFYSTALHRNADYLIYLPPGYKPPRRYPVLYLLHGMPGRPAVFIDIANMDVRLDNLLSQGQVRPMILVYPDGRIDGSTYSDSEWANTSSGDFENYVINVVGNVDQQFSTLPERQDRVIGGFSAGAYGAINIALHHLAEFGSVQVWSGYFTESRGGVFAHATRPTLDYNSPIDFIGTLKTQLRVDPLRVFMFVGRDDDARVQIVPMAQALKTDGANVSYAIYAGGHDWSVWYPRLNQMLILASQDVSHPLLPSSAAAGLTARARAARLLRRASHDHRGGARGRRHSIVAHRRAATRRRHSMKERRRAAAKRRRAVAGVVPRRPHARQRGGRRQPRLVGALLLALVSAVMINLGFLLQHRGLVSQPQGRTRLGAALRSRLWLAGQALGWIGFGAQILAVAIAPLSLVQAFAAGGLAISVPLAAGLFGYRISRGQLLAVLLIAASLACLPVGLSTAHGHLSPSALVRLVAVALPVAVVIGLAGPSSLRAIAAGLFYGIADAAIKASSIEWRVHGSGALLSGWTVLAVLATCGGFATFQAALRAGSPVSAISLMNALAALVAVGCGVFAFGESLGRTSTATLVHLLAISIVLGCVPVLAMAQQEMADAGRLTTERVSRPLPLAPGYRSA